MQEQEQQNPIQEQAPKKRGRKPKASVEKPISEEVKIPKKRGRKPKNKTLEKELSEIEKTGETTANGPVWRDAPEPVQESEQSESEREEILFVPKIEDDFAYATNTEQSASESDIDESEEIPTSFSTTDEDLIQDNYHNSWASDDDDYDDENDTHLESIIEAEQDENSQNSTSQQKINGGYRQNQNRQNNKWRKDNNKFNKNQNQNRFNNKNQNRNQNNNNNNRLNQQNNQNRNRQQNQNQKQNNQQKQNKQNKQKWLQQSSQSDSINPVELFDWDALKSIDGIEKYLAKLYFGKVEEPPVAIIDNSQVETVEDASPTQSEQFSEQQEHHTGLVETREEEPKEDFETQQESLPSYWEMLGQSNKELYEKSEGIEKENPLDSDVQNIIQETFEPEQEDFSEDFTFAIADCPIIESLENFNEVYAKPLKEISQYFETFNIPHKQGLNKNNLLSDYFNYALAQKKLVKISGIVDVFEDGYGGAIVFDVDNYRLRKFSVYIPKLFIDKYSLSRGHYITVLAAPPKSSDSCPFAVKICSVMGKDPNAIKNVVAFNDLVPYYPTERIIMESDVHSAWNNVSMRAVDLLSPIGLGQRALIVAPPRTGKTVLMQTMAKSIRANKPNAHLMVLLVDERPEEVTDFKRSVDAEVIASTFDEEASNHVHAAEIVISKARRMVEDGKDVIILLDSITRLARAYNALMPNGGRTMSGGVEATALQKPKKFFGSARNIEGGGSLTIIGTALVETGSKMDEVIFEEFKGTGNLELHLDRSLSDKRIFPAINMEKTGTRKEELLYHPDELEKIYTLRRAMHGVPITESMEMLVQRLKKTKTNVEFLLGLNR